MLGSEYGLNPNGGVGSMAPGTIVSSSGGGGFGPNYTGGNGGASAGPSIAQQMQNQQNAANKAAQKQYKKLMQQFHRTQRQQNRMYGKAQGLTKNLGQEAIADANMNGTQREAAAGQGLISRGLGNTTIVDSVNRGINSDTRREIRGIREGVSGQRAGLFAQQAGAALPLGQFGADSILSRQIQQPNTAMYIQLLQQMAANGGTL